MRRRRFYPPSLRIWRVVLILTLRIHIIHVLHVIIPIVALEHDTIFQRFELSFGLEDPGVHSGLDGFLADLLQPSFFGDFGSGVWIFGCPADVEDLVVVEGLAGHGFFGELGVVFVDVGHECYASVL